MYNRVRMLLELGQVAKQTDMAVYDRKLASTIYMSAIPQHVRDSFEMVSARMDSNHLQDDGKWGIDRILSLTGTGDVKLRMMVVDSGGQVLERNRSLLLTFETPLPNRPWASKVIISTDNPHYATLLEMYASYTKLRGINQIYTNVVDCFLSKKYSGGQIRRDWPELLNFMPPSTQARLGATRAKGKPQLSTEEEMLIPEINQELALCMLLPEQKSKRLAFDFG